MWEVGGGFSSFPFPPIEWELREKRSVKRKESSASPYSCLYKQTLEKSERQGRESVRRALFFVGVRSDLPRLVPLLPLPHLCWQ